MKFPEAGWEIRSRDNISPQFSRNLDRFTEFLTLVGLTSLIVGGVGVANAVRGFVERKRQTIAALKALGATGSTVFTLMLTQTMLVACAGVVLGAAAGVGIPFAAAFAFGSMIPFPLAPAIYPAAVGKGLLYGFLTALAFSAGPLGRAHDLPVQALFRAEVDPPAATLRPRYIILTLAAALCLALAVLGFATDPRLVLIYMGATLAAFVVSACRFVSDRGWRKKSPPRAERRVAARDRQYSPARRPDHFGCSVAWPWTGASCRADPHRRQHKSRTRPVRSRENLQAFSSLTSRARRPEHSSIF